MITEVLPLPVRRLAGRVVNRIFEQLSPVRLVSLGVAAGPHGVLRRGRKGLTVRKARAAAGGIDLGPLQARLPSLIGTKDRRVHLAPEDFIAGANALLDDARRGNSITAPTDGYDLQLIGRRHLRSNNSWLHNVATMVKGRDRCTALMHPDDAAKRGLSHGERVAVTSPTGSIVVTCEVSNDIRAGTIAIPHGWGHNEPGVGWQLAASLPGANVNLLHDPSLTDQFSGNAAVNNTWVTVAAVPPESVTVSTTKGGRSTVPTG